MSPRPEHLDTLVLAEHAEGLLPPPEATYVGAHLQTCNECRALTVALAEVSVQLAAQPREVTMPDAVAARITNALEAERPAPEVASTPARVDGFFSRLRQRSPVLLAAAAAIGVIGVVGYAVSSGGLGGGADSDTATADAGAGEAEVDAPEEAAEAPESVDESAGDGDDAGDTAADAPADDGPDALRGNGVGAAEESDLTAEIRDLVMAAESSPATLEEGCGSTLASAAGQELIGSAETDLVSPNSVLVVITTDEADIVEGWVVPECSSGAADSLANLRATAPSE